MAGENPIGEIPVLITGDYSNLEAAISSAVGAAEKGADSIAQAFDQPDVGNALSTSLSNIGDSADQAAAQIVPMADAVQGLGNESQTSGTSVEGLGHSVEQAGESAHEAESQFSELTQELLKLGGISLSIEGLKELVTESISAYASVQRATEAITAMTHSAETANEIIEKLKALSLSDAVSFPSLVTAEQRFVAMKVELEKIPAALNAIADSSRATARDFDTVAQKLENIALSGAVMPRSLIALGLQVEDLAQVMGISAGKVKDAFKDLDPTERVQVITEALKKYEGLAKATADDITGSWQRLKNQADFTFEEIGKAVAPAASGIMSFASNAVLPAVDQVVAQFSRLIESGGRVSAALEAIWKAGGLVEYLNSVYEALNKLTSLDSRMKEIGGWSTLFHDLANAMVPGANAAELLAGALDGLTGKGPQIDAMNKLIVSGLHQVESAARMGGAAFKEAWDLSVVQAGIGNASAAISKITDAQQKANVELNSAREAFNQINESFKAGTSLGDGYVATAQDVARAQAALEEATRKANIEIKAQSDSVAGIEAAFRKAQTTFDNAVIVFEKLTQRFQEGAAGVGPFLEAYSKVEAAAKAVGQSFSNVDAEVQKLIKSSADQQRALTDSIAVWSKLHAAEDAIPGATLAAGEAMKVVEEKARAMGIAVTQDGESLQFGLADKAKIAGGNLQELIDTLNGFLPAADKVGVIVNGKFVPALKAVSDSLSDVVSTTVQGTGTIHEFGDGAETAAGQFGKLADEIKVLKPAIDDTTASASTQKSAVQSLADTWIYMNGAWENAADLAEKVTHGMMDEADEAYKAATAVNTFAQAERDAAAAADKLASSSKGSKFGGGGSGGGGDKRFSWSMGDPSSNGFGGGGSDGSISLQGYLEDLISFATSPLASANGALPQSVIDGLALLAGGMTGTGGRLPDGGGSIGPLSTAAEAATKSITNLAAATNIQTSNLTDQQKIAILLNSGMKLYGDATGAVTAALSDVAGAAGDAANALDNVGSGPGGALTAGEQAQVAQMKGDQPPDSSGFWAKDAQGRWYRTDLPVSQSSIDASNNGIANLDQATGKWVAAVKLGAETFNVAADSSRDAYNAIQDAINRFVETGTTKLPVAQAGVMAQVAANASDGIAQFDAASGKWVGTLHVGTQVLNVAASTAQQAYDQMQVAMQRFANTGTFNVPTVQAGALGSGASGGNRFGQTNLPSGLSIDQMEANLNKGLPATFGQYGSVSVPITVQAGTVVGVNGMGQLAQMVGDEVIKNLRQVAGLKL